MKPQLFTVDVLVVVCVCILISIEALTYRDLERIRFENCPRKNSCARIGNTTFLERVCECDSNCSTFGDCCIDANRAYSGRTQSRACMHYGNYTYQGTYVFNSCSNGYLGPDEIIFQCMSNNFSDPLVSAPVTDTVSSKTYLNQYCAICNDVSPSSMKVWKIYFACGNSNQENRNLQWDDLKYRPDLKKWGYESQGRFKPCKFIYDKPTGVSAMGRQCRPNLITSCSSAWIGQTLRRECGSYMSVVTDLANKAYKNPHCALCNNVNSTELICLSPDITVRAKVPFSIALLFDVNTRNGDVVGVSNTVTSSCPRGQKYDPYFKKCRPVGCAIPGYRERNGKCVKQ